MKFKSFGLIEAIISSGIIIIFVVAMAFVSVKANKIAEESKHTQVAKMIATDFFERFFMLRDTGHVTFSSSQDNQVISVECFATDKAENCKNNILDAYPQNKAPFFDMISGESFGSYKFIAHDYLAADELNDDFFKIKTQVSRAECGKQNNLKIPSSQCRIISLEIIWQESSGVKRYQENQFVGDL